MRNQFRRFTNDVASTSSASLALVPFFNNRFMRERYEMQFSHFQKEVASAAAQWHREPVMHSPMRLSTAHLSSVTREIMDNDAVDAHVEPRKACGWFVQVSTWENDVYIGSDCPHDLAACLVFAGNVGADWIVFDDFAQVIVGLPIYAKRIDALAQAY